MIFDTSLPNRLKKNQMWFASIITRPIDENSQMNPVSPLGDSMVEEAARYILPSPTMQPHDRMQIYCQQYWWRLLNVFHDILPLTVCLLGYRTFNEQIGKPYLKEHPPDHWSLNNLGNRLERWMEKNYKNEKIFHAVQLDLAYNDNFFKAHFPSLKDQKCRDPEILASKLLTLQPHISLFCFPYPLLSFRDKVTQQGDADFWQTHRLPSLPNEKTCYILWRDGCQNLCWEEISEVEYHLLLEFKKGTTITKACENLEEDQALDDLASWFETWTIRGWLIDDTHSA